MATDTLGGVAWVMADAIVGAMVAAATFGAEVSDHAALDVPNAI